MNRHAGIAVILILLLASVTVYAQETSKIQLSDIELPNLRWGTQEASLNIFNNSDMLKYIGIVAEVQFSGSYLEPRRESITFVILSPGETKDVRPVVRIPGNYGRATVTIGFYDVADTNDVILPTQKFNDQLFSITYHCPDVIASYFSEKITMPPRVDVHHDFDNEFSRVLLYLLAEGKSIEQIAEMAAADVSFVEEIADKLENRNYLRTNEGQYSPAFPVITLKEAEAVKPLVLKTTEALTALIKAGMPAYRSHLDEMAEAGTIAADSNEFMSGGSFFYHRYPVIGAFLLWYDLGQQFIIKRERLNIYQNSDPCDANILYFMYAAQGGDTFNGTHFYHWRTGINGYSVFFGKNSPDLDCSQGRVRTGYKQSRTAWYYRLADKPEDFMFDSSLVLEALGPFHDSTDILLEETLQDLARIANDFGRASVSYGHRYWFWNQVATRTLEILVDEGIVLPNATGQYRFIGVSK